MSGSIVDELPARRARYGDVETIDISGAIAGVVVPYRETVLRVVYGYPVVTRYQPQGPLWALRQWGRFRNRWPRRFVGFAP